MGRGLQAGNARFCFRMLHDELSISRWRSESALISRGRSRPAATVLPFEMSKELRLFPSSPLSLVADAFFPERRDRCNDAHVSRRTSAERCVCTYRVAKVRGEASRGARLNCRREISREIQCCAGFYRSRTDTRQT